MTSIETSIQTNTVEENKTQETLSKKCGEKPVFESVSTMSFEEKDDMLKKIKSYSVCVNNFGEQKCINNDEKDVCEKQNKQFHTQCKNFGEILEYTGILENRFDPLNGEFFKLCNACVIQSCQPDCDDKQYESCLETMLFNVPMMENLKKTELKSIFNLRP